MTRILIIAGVCSVLIGATSSTNVREPTPVADTDTAFLWVGCGTNTKCKVPEPDCPQTDCYEWTPGVCLGYDDWMWSEQNGCDADTGTECDLSDYQECYVRQQCDKDPFWPCNEFSRCDVENYHKNCRVDTIESHDDCETHPL